IVLLGTLNTKEIEGQYIRNQIERFGHKTILIDISMRKCTTKLKDDDISNETVMEAADSNLSEVESLERLPAINIMVKGAKKIVQDLYDKKKLDGILGYGGSMGESISSLVIKSLPLHVPKVLVTTSLSLAAGSVGPNNIAIFPTVTDMNGKRVNRIEAITLAHAASAIAGMSEAQPEIPEERDIIVASQYGNTTPHIDKARELLDAKGYEFISFHAVGSGGEILEELVGNGMVVGVLDITTHEVVDWLFGGFSNSGPKRMETAGEKGVPQVLAPGCLDMIQFWSLDTVPEKFRGREFYFHNQNSTLMRTSKTESAELGKVFAEKANKAVGPTVVVIPLRGWSILDTEGKYLTVHYDGTSTGRYWYDPEANSAFIETLEKNMEKSKDNIELIKVDLNINDPQFAQITSSILDDMIIGNWKKGKKYN
ncbi:MAG: Tm-1-like ATP-binding domain-containing protein, partial [Candidatus Humimicrobiaceae bacterium]